MGTLEKLDSGIWRCHMRLERYHEDIAPFEGDEFAFHARYEPYDVHEQEGNLLVTAGLTAIYDLICDTSPGNPFDSTNAYIGVGDSSTAASVGQTDLQAASNKVRKGMEATYPLTSGSMAFKSSFSTGEANFAWNEWAVFNASSSGTMLNRKVASLGTKSSGTWTLEVTITIS